MWFLILVRRLFRVALYGGSAANARIAWYASLLRSRAPRIRRQWRGERQLETARRIAVLVHFARDGRFLAYFRYLVRELDRAGYAVIIVSNSRTVSEDAVAELLPQVAAIVHRRNVGYDFGAWRDGLALIPDLGKLDSLVLTNDSIFGPLHDLGTVLARCDAERADVWGITNSYSFRYHLQSYFLVFHSRALQSSVFAKFWKTMRYIENKNAVVTRYEVGLSQVMLRAGLRLRALYPYPELVDEVILRRVQEEADLGVFENLVEPINAGVPLNPTHFFWQHLIVTAGCPFIKRDLLEKNPVRIPFLGNWRRAIASTSSYPIEMIDEYLQVASRNRVF